MRTAENALVGTQSVRYVDDNTMGRARGRRRRRRRPAEDMRFFPSGGAVTPEWVDLACGGSAIAKFYADIWQKQPASQSSWMHVYAFTWWNYVCAGVLLWKSIPPTTDRPTDQPTHRPNRAQTHTTAPSPRPYSVCFLLLQPSLPLQPTPSASSPPRTRTTTYIPAPTTHHFFNPKQQQQHHENRSAGIYDICVTCRLLRGTSKACSPMHPRLVKLR